MASELSGPPYCLHKFLGASGLGDVTLPTSPDPDLDLLHPSKVQITDPWQSSYPLKKDPGKEDAFCHLRDMTARLLGNY